MKIKIMERSTRRTWEENFTSYYLMQKRINKIRYSKKLIVISSEY